MNTRLAFDTEILLKDNKKNSKVLFDLLIDGKKQPKRISSKILIMDENNQYGQAMTKPLQYGCIKKQEHALLREEITQTFNSKTFALNKDEPTYEARKKNTMRDKWKKN